MLRAYRKNDYTGAIEGYVIETGLGFIISVVYKRFRHIFLSKAARREKRAIRKENKRTEKQIETAAPQAMLPSKENDNENQQ